MNLSKKIKNLLYKYQKQENDIKLIEKYFQKKYNTEKEINSIYFEKYEKEILEFVLKYSKNDYPLQYLVGFEEFGKLEIMLNSHVLIPRMETEEVVRNFCQKIRNKYPKNSSLKIADVCTGSGNIIILINHLLKDSYKITYYASDISLKALNLAKKNFQKYKINVHIFRGNYLEPYLAAGIKLDCIISNPPYIDYHDIIGKTVKYEPSLALFADEKGLEPYNEMSKKIRYILKEKSLLCFEIGQGQGIDIKTEYRNLNFFTEIAIIKDMNDKDRIVMMEKV